MQIGSTLIKPNFPSSNATKSVAPPATEPALEAPADQVTFDQEAKTPGYVKAGKYALAAATTAGAGALAYYAATNVGGAAAAAGVLTGGLAGVAVLGTLGLVADIGNIMGSSNYTLKGALAGGVLGTVAGGVIGYSMQNPVVGGVMAAASGISALALTGAATNILRK